MSLHASTLSPAAQGRSAPQHAARDFSPRRLIPATGAALAASLVGVLAIRTLAVSGANQTSRFSPLRAATVLPLMAMHVLVATVCLVALPRLGQAHTSAYE
jgi:hypothetical protein